MAHRKAAGKTKNVRDSQPKFLGIKLSDGMHAQPGAIIVRQRGTKFSAGDNVGMGTDHTLFALKAGVVQFKERRKKRFNGAMKKQKVVTILET